VVLVGFSLFLTYVLKSNLLSPFNSEPSDNGRDISGRCPAAEAGLFKAFRLSSYYFIYWFLVLAESFIPLLPHLVFPISMSSASPI
jgi:hypothetical protein